MKTYKYKVEVDQNSMNQQMMQVAASRMNGLMAQSMVGTVAPLSATGMLATYTPGLASLAGLSPTGGMSYGPDATLNQNQYGVMAGASVAKGVADFAVPWGIGSTIGGGVGMAAGMALGGPIGAGWGASIGGFVGGFAGDSYLGGAVGSVTGGMVDFATGRMLAQSRMGAMASLSTMGSSSVTSGYGMAEAAFSAVGAGARNTLSAGMSDSDMADIGVLGFQSGQLSGGQDMETFTNNYKKLIKSTRDIMKTLGQSHKEAIGAMRDMQNMGIFNTDEASQAIINEGTRSAYTSFSSGQLRGLRGQGFNMGFNSELGGVQSGNMMTDYSTFASSGMSRNVISKITGQSGAAGDAAMGQILTNSAIAFGDSDLGKSLFSSMLTPDMGYDKDYAQKLITGNYDIYNTDSRVNRMLSSVDELNPEKLRIARSLAMQEMGADDMTSMIINAAKKYGTENNLANDAGGITMGLMAGGMNRQEAASQIFAYNNLVGFSKIEYTDATAPEYKRRAQEEAYQNSWGGMYDRSKMGGYQESAWGKMRGYAHAATGWAGAPGGLGSGALSKNWMFEDHGSERFNITKTPIRYNDLYVANLEEQERLLGSDYVGVGKGTMARGYATDTLFDELGLDEVASENAGWGSKAWTIAKRLRASGSAAFTGDDREAEWDQIDLQESERSRKHLDEMFSKKYGIISGMIAGRADILGKGGDIASWKRKFTKGTSGEELAQASRLFSGVMRGIRNESGIKGFSERMRKIKVRHGQQGIYSSAVGLSQQIRGLGGAKALGISKEVMESLGLITSGSFTGRNIKDLGDVLAVDSIADDMSGGIQAEIGKLLHGLKNEGLSKIESDDNFKKYYYGSMQELGANIVGKLNQLIDIQLGKPR